MVPPSKAESCAIVAAEVGRSCPRIKSLEPASCEATEMPVVAQHSNRGVYLLGPGTFVHFGPKFEWYVRHDRTVLTNSDDAAKYCADLQTAAVWLKPKLEEEEMAATWCTDENIAKARVIDLEMSEVGFGSARPRRVAVRGSRTAVSGRDEPYGPRSPSSESQGGRHGLRGGPRPGHTV